jgi:hypothetical protein
MHDDAHDKVLVALTSVMLQTGEGGVDDIVGGARVNPQVGARVQHPSC